MNKLRGPETSSYAIEEKLHTWGSRYSFGIAHYWYALQLNSRGLISHCGQSVTAFELPNIFESPRQCLKCRAAQIKSEGRSLL